MWIDAHAHLDRYDLLGEGALGRALAEITQHRIVTLSNSMDLPSYRRNLEIGRSCPFVWPAFGVHPWNAPEYAGCLEELAEAIEGSPMLGEIGLDHYFVRDRSALPVQRLVLEYFLRAARDQGKVVTLHTKGAEGEVLELLDRYDLPRVIVHWYSGPPDTFREMLARGFYFTVGVEALYSEGVRAIAREIPWDRLLTETDNPGGPSGFLGQPGTPRLVEEVVRGVAEARGATSESVLQAVEANLRDLIGGDRCLSEWRAVLEEESGSG